MLIDTHAHLNSEAFEDDYKHIIQEALDENIRMIIVGSDIESSQRAIAIAEEFEKGVFASVGFHPKYLGDVMRTLHKYFDIKEFEEMVEHPKVVALGEVGLDYHDLPREPSEDPHIEHSLDIKRLQKEAVVQFLDLSAKTRLPVIMHCREAHADLIDLLEQYDAAPGSDSRGIMHAFSGSWQEAVRFLNLDFYLSFTGLSTYAHFETAVIAKTPAEKILIESLCPYLTPESAEGGRNEPSYLRDVLVGVALIKDKTDQEMEKILLENSLRIFPKIKL